MWGFCLSWAPIYRESEGEARNNFCRFCGEMGAVFQGALEGLACAWFCGEKS